MSDTQLSTTDRIEAVLYQYVNLYERWSEDRQAAAKQSAEITKLIQTFTEQVQKFKTLEQHVKHEIKESIRNAAVSIEKHIGEEIVKVAADKTSVASEQLQSSARQAALMLDTYKREVIATRWHAVLISSFTTIITCLLLVWLIIPSPTLPLTNQQINILNEGRLLQLIWPKLTDEEQKHWKQIADEVAPPE